MSLSSASLMFWTNWNEQHPSIMRAALSGANALTLIEKDIRTPNGLAIDHRAEKLYFSDATLDKIERCEYDGSHRYVSLQGRRAWGTGRRRLGTVGQPGRPAGWSGRKRGHMAGRTRKTRGVCVQALRLPLSRVTLCSTPLPGSASSSVVRGPEGPSRSVTGALGASAREPTQGVAARPQRHLRR